MADAPQQQPEPTYAHPAAAFFLVFFKASAIIYYLICEALITDKFNINFCVVAFLLMCDFWTVKNVSGRLMVGLRWWNEVSENGGSEWRFETLPEGQRAVDKKDSFLFWTVLYGTPAIWVLLGVVAVIGLEFSYLILVIIAVLLSSANLTGYLKCSKAQRAQLKGMATGLFTTGLRAAFSRT